MRIFIASDHAGFELKKKIISFVFSLGHEAIDKGPFEFNERDDYPDFMAPVALSVANGEGIGIIMGGSGQGEAMVANRVRGVRAGVYYGGALEAVRKMREHNNANILSLGARFVTEKEAMEAVKTFLETPFGGDERHVRRIRKIDEKITK
ncbi:MAG: RpiB/LacA/LacB family sugar-phosphate isomerase [Patescibacteria group bacterium]